jgi:hypothetical protein
LWVRITEPPPPGSKEERTNVSYLSRPAADAALPATSAGFRLAHFRVVATATATATTNDADADADADTAASADDQPPVPGLIVYAHAPDACDAGEAGL